MESATAIKTARHQNPSEELAKISNIENYAFLNNRFT